MKSRVFLQLMVILLPLSSEVLAQGFGDNALLFSRTRPGGSARIQAMGGAQVALGGDFSSALSNPAGLGMYNRSEFTLSPAINFYQTDAEHFGVTENESKSLLNIPGLSYVHHFPQNKNGFLGGSFGISMSRTNDFSSVMRYSGNDRFSSIVDYFIEDATGLFTDELNFDLPTGLAYDNYLLDDSTFWGGPERYYFSVMGLYDDPNDIRRLTRQGTVKIKGAQYQWSLAYGGNLNDKFFFGANVGITTLRYKFQSTYNESNFSFDLDPDFNPLDNLQLEETIDIEGTGVNLTLGVIYRPIDNVQVGASFVTPTYYQLTDSYSARLSTRWNSYDYLGTGTILNTFDYQSNSPLIAEYTLTTPMKLSLGAAFFISDYGFVTGDVEFVNYKKAKYDSDVIDLNPDNDFIQSAFKNTTNYRLGAEFRYEILRFRAGYNVQSSPYDDSFDIDRSLKTLSAGIGVRVKKFFGDLAWLNTTGDTAYSPYVFQDGFAPVVGLKNQVNSFILTFGINF
jgi:hypothetical protein